MAIRFVDLHEKRSSCSSDLAGHPRKIKYHGLVTRPEVDIHNHFCTGSTSSEDAWQTKNAILSKGVSTPPAFHHPPALPSPIPKVAVQQFYKDTSVKFFLHMNHMLHMPSILVSNTQT